MKPLLKIGSLAAALGLGVWAASAVVSAGQPVGPSGTYDPTAIHRCVPGRDGGPFCLTLDDAGGATPSRPFNGAAGSPWTMLTTTRAQTNANSDAGVQGWTRIDGLTLHIDWGFDYRIRGEFTSGRVPYCDGGNCVYGSINGRVLMTRGDDDGGFYSPREPGNYPQMSEAWIGCESYSNYPYVYDGTMTANTPYVNGSLTGCVPGQSPHMFFGASVAAGDAGANFEVDYYSVYSYLPSSVPPGAWMEYQKIPITGPEY